MRISHHRGAVRPVLVALCAIVAGACGGAQATPPPAAVAPLVTPNPHLAEPATADQVWRALGAAGLRIVANNAVSGTAGKEPIKRINATYGGWPLTLAQFSSSRALRREIEAWKDGERPGQGEAPISISGMNILVTWGPTTGKSPKVPDARKADALTALVGVLDPLLSPMQARAVVPVDFPSATPTPAPTPTPTPEPTKKPKKTPKP
jgi:hypothetical protein